MRNAAHLLLAALAASAAAPAQDSRSAADSRPTYDLRSAPAPYALRLETTVVAKGELALVVDGRRVALPVDETATVRHLDEMIARKLEPRSVRTVTYRRTVLDAQLTKKPYGPCDDGSAGLSVEFADASDGKNAWKKDRRTAPRRRTMLDRLVLQAPFICAELGLKAGVPVGGRVPIETGGLLHSWFDFDGEMSRPAGFLELVSVDEKTGRAKLIGEATCEERTPLEFPEHPVALTHYVLKLTVEFDLAAGFITKIEAEGRALAEAEKAGGVGVSGEVKFTAKTTVVAVKDAAAARAAKPAYRDVRRRSGRTSFTVPSCWLVSETKDDGGLWFDGRTGENSPTLEVEVFAQQNDPTSDDFIRGFLNSVREADPKAKAEKSTVGGKKALAARFSLDDGARAGRAYVVACGPGRLVRLLLKCAPADLARCEADLKKAAGSVKIEG
jgi:hypothetical protein